MDKKVVKTMLTTSLGLRPDEELLIVGDEPMAALAEEVYAQARALGYNTTLIKIAARAMPGEEPPRVVADALKSADAALLLNSKSLSHTRARKEACRDHGTRIASLPGATKAMLERAIPIDYNKLRKNVNRLIARLERAEVIEIHTEKGTRLTARVKGRKAFRDHGFYTKKGDFGNLPAGETCVAPLEGTTNGLLVVDGSAPFVGVVKKPVEMVIEKGFALNVPFPEIQKRIKHLGKPARNIAELGFGFNPSAKITGLVLEDEKVIDTFHVALGNNKSFGGKVGCPCHLDLVVHSPILFLDGKRVKLY